LFKQDNVELEFEPTALTLLAKNTIKNKTGARGLHSELERVLLPHMFNIANYRTNGVGSLKITEALVNTPIELKDYNAEINRKVSTGT
jgi:ATP-dependent Clp protease ATP-binding subunit ClpX